MRAPKIFILAASALVIIMTTACTAADAQADPGTPTPQPTTIPPPSIKVAIDGQSSRVAWPSLPDSVGYRIAWVNLRDMLAAMDDGAHWTERMSHTNLPASRTSHRVMHLQPDTRHAFAVGVDAPDGTIRWSRWSYVTTGPAEACSCQQGPQTPAAADRFQPPPQHIEAARAAIAEHDFRVSGHPGQLVFAHAEPVTWPDGSIGCAQDGYVYTAAEVKGSVMLFKFYDSPIFVHASHEPFHIIVPHNCQ